MRKVLFTFISLFIAISSCVNQSEETMHRLLKQIDGMLRSAPDTAYYLLQQLPVTETTPQADSAYRELLLLEAQLRNDIKLKDTLSVCGLADFYRERKDTVMLARSYRLLAATYHDLGLKYFHKTTDHYNTAIALAGAKDEKRVLADACLELAQAYYDKSYWFRKEPPRTLTDPLLCLTEQTAEALNDTVLWVKSLITRYRIWDGYERDPEWESRLLLTLRLSEEAGLNEYGAMAAMGLSMLYAELGEKEKSFSYAQRDLALRKGLISDYIYYSNLSSAYSRIGMKDSADYYENKAMEMRGEEDYPAYSNPIKQTTEEPESEKGAFISMLLLVVVLVTAILFWQKRQIRKRERRKSEEILQLKQEIETLTAEGVSVLDKIRQIVDDYQYKSHSDFRMEEADWKQLQLEMDRQWDYAVTKLQREYDLTTPEVRLLCLNLADIPASQIPFLFDRSRNTLYLRHQSLSKKLGMVRKHTTLKKDFQEFVKNNR